MLPLLSGGAEDVHSRPCGAVTKHGQYWRPLHAIPYPSHSAKYQYCYPHHFPPEECMEKLGNLLEVSSCRWC